MKQRHEVVAVLDRSGSMSSQVDDVIGGFNTYITNIAKSSADEGVDTNITLLLFDDNVEIVYESQPVQNLEPLTRNVYYTRGSTALLDAVGQGITCCKNAIARPINALDAIVDGCDMEPIETTVTFVIFTDGAENASRTHTQADIAKNIKDLTNEGWTFIYLGADQDKWHAGSIAGGLNIATGNAMGFTKSSNDFNNTFNTLSAGAAARLKATKAGFANTNNFFEEAKRELESTDSGDTEK